MVWLSELLLCLFDFCVGDSSGYDSGYSVHGRVSCYFLSLQWPESSLRPPFFSGPVSLLLGESRPRKGLDSTMHRSSRITHRSARYLLPSSLV